MRIGGIVVRVHPGTTDAVAAKLRTMSNIEIAHRTEAGFALVMQADSPTAQEDQHQVIADWPEVREASVVFQTNEV